MKTRIGLVALPILLTIAGSTAVLATEEISEQEEIECQVCHSDVEHDAAALTDRGLFYQTVDTMDGYDQVLERFESCTYCHSERAGNKSMTSEGHRFRWMMQNMAGLTAWLEENYPASDEEDQ